MANHTATDPRRRQRKAVVGTSLPPQVINVLDELAFKRYKDCSSPAAIVRLAVYQWLKSEGLFPEDLDEDDI